MEFGNDFKPPVKHSLTGGFYLVIPESRKNIG